MGALLSVREISQLMVATFLLLVCGVRLVILALSAPVPSRRDPTKKLIAPIAVPPVTARGLLPSILLATFGGYYHFS